MKIIFENLFIFRENISDCWCRFYEYVTIEDFNEQLKSIKITLSDLKLSCLCSKYSIPNELRLIDKNKIDIDIQKFKDGALRFDEDENDNN